MKFTLLVAVICATSASSQWVRKCYDSGLQASVDEGLSVVNTLCQMAANRPITAGGRIDSCVAFHSTGATPSDLDYRWELRVRHNAPTGLGIPPRFSDPNQCAIAVTAALQQCGGGVLTRGGFAYITNNVVEWEIDPNNQNSC